MNWLLIFALFLAFSTLSNAMITSSSVDDDDDDDNEGVTDSCHETIVYTAPNEHKFRFAVSNGFFGRTQDVPTDELCKPIVSIVKCLRKTLADSKFGENSSISTDLTTVRDAWRQWLDSDLIFHKVSSAVWLKCYNLDEEDGDVGYFTDMLIDCAHEAQPLGRVKAWADALEPSLLLTMLGLLANEFV